MSQQTEEKITVEDIEYRPGLLARLYRPQGAGPFPAIVDIHGGAWSNKDRFDNAELAEDLAHSGIVTLSLDFRMPPEAGYPASLQDINYAIRWFKQRAAEYGVRPDHIGLFGTSTGGHQALLTAMRPKNPSYTVFPMPGGSDASVAFVVSAWGILCPLARYHLAQRRGHAAMVANHHAFWPDEAAMTEGSPLLTLERDDLVTLPPVFVFQGDNDEWSPVGLTERFAAAYRRRGGMLELAVFEGEGHTFMREHPESPNSIKARFMLEDFIRKYG